MNFYYYVFEGPITPSVKHPPPDTWKSYTGVPEGGLAKATEVAANEWLVENDKAGPTHVSVLYYTVDKVGEVSVSGTSFLAMPKLKVNLN